MSAGHSLSASFSGDITFQNYGSSYFRGQYKVSFSEVDLITGELGSYAKYSKTVTEASTGFADAALIICSGAVSGSGYSKVTASLNSVTIDGRTFPVRFVDAL